MRKLLGTGCLILMLGLSGCMFKFTSNTGDECHIAVLTGYVEAELDPATGKVTWNRGGWYVASGIMVKKDGTDYTVKFDTSETKKVSLEELKTLLIGVGVL